MQRLSLCIDIDGTLESEQPVSLSRNEQHKESILKRGVREVIAELYQIHYIHFVTSMEESMVSGSINWLYRQQIPFDSLSILGSSGDEERIRELESDFFISDSLDHAARLAGAGIQVLLLDCSHNQGPALPNITRVYNWYHVKAAILRSLEQEAS